MNTIMQLIIAFLTLGLTYVLTSEGLWGSALMFFNVLFAAMISFNFYEPLAKLIDSTGINWGFSDTLCMLGLFCIALVILRLTTETIAPVMVRFPLPVYHAGRLIFGLAGGSLTMAIVILALHAAPVHKKIFSAIDDTTKPPFGLGLDHMWLGFFQYETGAVFANLGYGRPDPYRTYGHGGRVNVFDPKAAWLVDHYDARPYGTGSVLSRGDDSSDAGEKAAAPAGGGGGGGGGGRGGRGGGRGAAPP
jgi:uncharacterized membrane protein required for colicin V production